MKVDLYNLKGEVVGNIEVSSNVIMESLELISKELISKYVYVYLSNQRQGNAKTKDRSEVSGGGRKPYAQKGTGRARAGSIRSPLWRGGGVTFGPDGNRNYKKTLNKKERAKVFTYALTWLFHNSKMFVVDNINVSSRTKDALDILKNFNLSGKASIVTSTKKDDVIKAFRNLQNTSVALVTDINPYFLLNAGTLFIEKDALNYFNYLVK
jgi:large subunit ribosomal protein L4